jgi:hypothetical protein
VNGANVVIKSSKARNLFFLRAKKKRIPRANTGPRNDTSGRYSATSRRP